MVSLNEKRSKIRYVVQNKSEWNQDETGYGKKILEKHGWTSNVGLGKHEDGRKEHLTVNYKSNMKGLGYSQSKFDSTWIEHSTSFDYLLQQLQQSHSTDNHPSTISNFHQNVQETKTRFAYKKQSSSKDLSSKSNHDLGSIFGWNSSLLKNNDKFQYKKEYQQIEEETNKKEEQQSDNQLYTTSHLSIDEYFREKFRKKAEQSIEINDLIDSDSTLNSINQMNSQTKKRKSLEKENSLERISTEINCYHQKIDDQQNQDASKDIYLGSNLTKLNGYQGWNIQLSFEKILRTKEKQRKRKKKI